MEKALRAHHSDRNLDAISAHELSCVNTATDSGGEEEMGWLTHFQSCDLDNKVFLPIFVLMVFYNKAWQAGRDDKILVGFDDCPVFPL